jgi:hypothetical protein
METITTYSFTEAIRAPFASVFEPEKFFLRAGSMVDAILAALLLVTCRVALVIAYRPYFIRSILVSLPPQAVATFAKQGGAYLTTSFHVQIAGSILMPPAEVALTALLVYLALVAVGRMVTYGSLLRVATLASLVLAFRELFRFGVVALRGIDAIRSVRDFQPPVGLGLLFRNTAPFLQSAVDAVNLFDIWFLAVLVIALMKMKETAISRRDAIASVACFWAIWQLVRCGLLFFFAQTL